VSETVAETTVLVQRVKGGDRQALAEFFATQRQRLWRTLHFRFDYRLRSRVDPDDVLQEAFLWAAANVERFAGDSAASLYVWLRMVVLQTMIVVHRRHLGVKMRDAEREVPIYGGRLPQATSASLAVELSGHLTSPSQAAIRAEVAEQLRQILNQMAETDREVLALRHFEQLSNSEVAETLGIQEKAASIRYVRAIRRLRTIFVRLSGFADDRQGV
jgi:RNA polymerase sigma-70 factor, ECF subfamily